MNDRLLGIVLCGGRSSRMGRDKAALAHPLGGTFLSHATQRIRSLCEDVCIAGEVTCDTTLGVLADNVAYRGPVTGVASALRFAEKESYDGCLITPIDMPFLTTEDLKQICDTWRQSPNDLVCGISADDHRVQPLVAIYPAGLRESVCELAESEDRSIDRWIAQRDYKRIILPAESCRNINTPDDYSP